MSITQPGGGVFWTAWLLLWSMVLKGPQDWGRVNILCLIAGLGVSHYCLSKSPFLSFLWVSPCSLVEVAREGVLHKVSVCVRV